MNENTSCEQGLPALQVKYFIASPKSKSIVVFVVDGMRRIFGRSTLYGQVRNQKALSREHFGLEFQSGNIWLMPMSTRGKTEVSAPNSSDKQVVEARMKIEVGSIIYAGGCEFFPYQVSNSWLIPVQTKAISAVSPETKAALDRATQAELQLGHYQDRQQKLNQELHGALERERNLHSALQRLTAREHDLQRELTLARTPVAVTLLPPAATEFRSPVSASQFNEHSTTGGDLVAISQSETIWGTESRPTNDEANQPSNPVLIPQPESIWEPESPPADDAANQPSHPVVFPQSETIWESAPRTSDDVANKPSPPVTGQPPAEPRVTIDDFDFFS